MHSRPPRSERGRLLLTLRPDKELVLPAGLPPASHELEARDSVCLSYGSKRMAEAGGFAPHSRRNARFSGPPRCLDRFGFRGAPGRSLTDNPRLRTTPLWLLSYWSELILAPGVGVAPTTSRLTAERSTVELSGNEMVGRLGAAPSVSWSQTRRIAVFLAPRKLVESRGVARRFVRCHRTVVLLNYDPRNGGSCW